MEVYINGMKTYAVSKFSRLDDKDPYPALPGIDLVFEMMLSLN